MATHTKVEPERFLRVLLTSGLTRRQAAEAMGVTRSRITELTRSKGASVAIYSRFRESIMSYKREHHIRGHRLAKNSA